MRVGIAVSLLAGYLEAEFVECGLNEKTAYSRALQDARSYHELDPGSAPKAICG